MLKKDKGRRMRFLVRKLTFFLISFPYRTSGDSSFLKNKFQCKFNRVKEYYGRFAQKKGLITQDVTHGVAISET